MEEECGRGGGGGGLTDGLFLLHKIPQMKNFMRNKSSFYIKRKTSNFNHCTQPLSSKLFN